MLHVVRNTLDLYGMVVTAKLPESYLVTTPTLPLCLVIACGTTYERLPFQNGEFVPCNPCPHCIISLRPVVAFHFTSFYCIYFSKLAR